MILLLYVRVSSRVTKNEIYEFFDGFADVSLVPRRVRSSLPPPFPVMFCTVNEEFAISRDSSWRCIHAWERRVPVIWPLRAASSKNDGKAQVLSPFLPVPPSSNAPYAPGTRPQKKISEGAPTVGPHIVLSEHADWAIKAWSRPPSRKFARQRVRYYCAACARVRLESRAKPQSI